jgi:hypothetical protein
VAFKHACRMGAGGYRPQAKGGALSVWPLGRLGEGEEPAPAVTRLAEEDWARSVERTEGVEPSAFTGR